jgi:hypothetical protein
MRSHARPRLPGALSTLGIILGLSSATAGCATQQPVLLTVSEPTSAAAQHLPGHRFASDALVVEASGASDNWLSSEREAVRRLSAARLNAGLTGDPRGETLPTRLLLNHSRSSSGSERLDIVIHTRLPDGRIAATRGSESSIGKPILTPATIMTGIAAASCLSGCSLCGALAGSPEGIVLIAIVAFTAVQNWPITLIIGAIGLGGVVAAGVFGSILSSAQARDREAKRDVAFSARLDAALDAHAARIRKLLLKAREREPAAEQPVPSAPERPASDDEPGPPPAPPSAEPSADEEPKAERPDDPADAPTPDGPPASLTPALAY